MAGSPRRARSGDAADDRARSNARRKTLSLAHYDPARDYQTGVQRARRPGAGTRDERVDLPAVLGAGAAKAMAEALLARAETGRERRIVALPADAAGIAPGDARGDRRRGRAVARGRGGARGDGDDA